MPAMATSSTPGRVAYASMCCWPAQPRPMTPARRGLFVGDVSEVLVTTVLPILSMVILVVYFWSYGVETIR